MNILVTGGTGYVGSHTCVILLEAGHSVIISYDFCNSDRESIKNIQRLINKEIIYFEIDVMNANVVDDFLSKHKINGLIHFASLNGVVDSLAL